MTKTIKQLREAILPANRVRATKVLHTTIYGKRVKVPKGHEGTYMGFGDHGGHKVMWDTTSQSTVHTSHDFEPVNESTHPETYLDNPHIERLNGILDQITGKYFINLQVFVDAVRAALDFHGFKLPHLDCEQETHGPSQPRAYGDIIHGPGFEDNRNVPGIPTEFEYIFQIKYDTPSEADYPLYLYMCADRVDQDGDNDSKELYWETYAQVVTKDELADLADMADDRKFPEPIGDASGETEYLRKQRHTNTTGTSPEDDIE